MASSTTDGDVVKHKTQASCSSVVLLSISCTLFLSLVLLYGCTYFTLRSQLEQLRTDVDQLKAVQSLSGADEAAGLHGDGQHRQRSKRHDASFNQSAVHNDTSDKDDEGSGEVTDNQYRGIWMGTYSRVPVSSYETAR